MNVVERVFRADATRPTRFHTSNGHLCLHPLEMSSALLSTFRRTILHQYAPMPWLVYSATRYIEPLVTGKRVIEFGSGMSTIWFSQRCEGVFSIESNENWYRSVSERCKTLGNVEVVFASSKEDYVGAPLVRGRTADVVLIDGLYRTECIGIARSLLTTARGLVVVDNTDRDSDSTEKIRECFGEDQISTFRGWVPGNLHPSETTAIRVGI